MTFAEVVRAAGDTPDPDEHIARVKAAVAAELSSLDGSAKVESTPFFNHSARPDFIVTWSGEVGAREVFLRPSYEAVAASNDEEALARADAMLLTLGSSESAESVRGTAGPRRSSRLLLTDTEAVGVIGESATVNARPLVSMVRANFLRGAKGVVDSHRAARLLELDDEQSLPDSSDSRSLIADSFAEDAAARITRTVELIAMAKGAHPSEASTMGGRLSTAELRNLLPWLLRDDSARTNRVFWRHLAALFTFRDFESIRDELRGLDVSPIVQANADVWTGRRAYIGVARGEREDAVVGENAAPRWSFEDGGLGVDVGMRRLFVSFDGNILKARPGGETPNWEKVRDQVRGRRIASIELKGVSRSVTLHAEASDDIRADIEGVTNSLDDTYEVNRMSFRVLAPEGEEGTVDVAVRYDEALVVADGSASLEALSALALQVLNFNDPWTAERFKSLLA